MISKLFHSPSAHFVLVVTTIWMFTPPAYAQKEGHGAGVVELNDGSFEPSDLHAKDDHFQIPSTYQKISLDHYPGLRDELKRAMDLGRRRGFPLPKDYPDFEFYIVPNFSGVDTEAVDVGLTPVQVSFTYPYREIGEKRRLHRAIEIKDDLFAPLDLKLQALIILHEYLHHDKNFGSHEVISPFIKGLLPLLGVQERQHKGDRSALQQDELTAATDLLALLKTMSATSWSKGSFKWPAEIVSKGGGIVMWGYGDANFPLSTDTFVGVDSVIDFQVYNPAFLFNRNEIVNSVVSISSVKDHKDELDPQDQPGMTDSRISNSNVRIMIFDYVRAEHETIVGSNGMIEYVRDQKLKHGHYVNVPGTTLRSDNVFEASSGGPWVVGASHGNLTRLTPSSPISAQNSEESLFETQDSGVYVFLNGDNAIATDITLDGQLDLASNSKVEKSVIGPKKRLTLCASSTVLSSQFFMDNPHREFTSFGFYDFIQVGKGDVWNDIVYYGTYLTKESKEPVSLSGLHIRGNVWLKIKNRGPDLRFDPNVSYNLDDVYSYGDSDVPIRSVEQFNKDWSHR